MLLCVVNLSIISFNIIIKYKNQQINMCDIDCCCDIDCTDQMLQAFTCNHEIYTIHNYNHLSALPSCQLENSLFCIIRDNVKSRDHKIFDLNLRQTIKYKWPTVFADTADDDDRHHYQFGDPIYVYDELAEDVKTFGNFTETFKLKTNFNYTFLRQQKLHIH